MNSCEKEEYTEILGNEKNTPADIARKTKKWSKEYLYKYKSFNLDYLKAEVMEGDIYLSLPKDFNDPMDCLIYFEINNNFEQSKLNNYFQNNMYFQHINIQTVLKDVDKKELIMEGYREDIRCTCFSESYQNLLMWSHYADKHSGFCIGYKMSEFGKIVKDSLYPVLYVDQKPDVTKELLNLSNNALIKALVTKATPWKYEQEWRIVVSNGKDHFYEKDAIDTIYLGAKCSEKNRNEILNMVKSRNIKVIQMKIDTREYKLIEECLL